MVNEFFLTLIKDKPSGHICLLRKTALIKMSPVVFIDILRLPWTTLNVAK